MLETDRYQKKKREKKVQEKLRPLLKEAPQWKALLSFEEPAGLEACWQSCRQLPLLLGLGKLIRPENCQVCSEGTGERSREIWRKFKPPPRLFFFSPENLRIVKNQPELPLVKRCLIIKLGRADPARRYSDEVLGLGSFHRQEIFWNPEWMLKLQAGHRCSFCSASSWALTHTCGSSRLFILDLYSKFGCDCPLERRRRQPGGYPGQRDVQSVCPKGEGRGNGTEQVANEF